MKMVTPNPSVQVPQMKLSYKAFILQQWQGITEEIKQKSAEISLVHYESQLE
jgi:hypothetical protein